MSVGKVELKKSDPVVNAQQCKTDQKYDSYLLLALPTGLGFLFGFALDRGLVNVPAVIRAQFDFSSFVMLRMFLSASVTSTVVVSAMHTLGYQERTPKPCVSLCSWDSTQVGANVLGGALLGSGMALSGSCPGTIWSQLGARPDANRLLVVLGTLVGAYLFGYINDHGLAKFQHTWLKKINMKLSTISPPMRHMLAYAFIAGATGLIFGVDHLFPWQKQIGMWVADGSHSMDFASGFLGHAWDPAIAGVLVGLLQIPWMMFLGNGLGSSSGWWCLATKLNFLDITKSMDRNGTDIKGCFQLFQGLGAIIGGYASHQLSTADPGMRLNAAGLADWGPLPNFLGGMLLIIGSRLGGGCTSGHGLTGVANMSFSSFVTVAAMFGGAIATKFLMECV